MNKVLSDSIPSLNLAGFTEGDLAKRSRFVADLGAAFNDIGFVSIKGHGLTSALSENLYKAIKAFFSLPETVKQKYEIPGLFGQRGYVGKGKEHAKGRKTGDLKEFYHIGQEVQEDFWKGIYPENVWPEEVPELKIFGSKVYSVLENVGLEMLRAIALYLQLEEDYFDQKVRHGNSILRPIHYFPIENPEEVPADAVRAAEHGDINLITLLMGATADGLQVLRRDGKWIAVNALPDQLIVNVGDMLARLTNNKLKSTVHRVVNPPRELMGSSRYSVPFFMHPRSEMDLTCLDSCVNDTNPKVYENINAGDFLNERLSEIGLKK